MDTIRYMRTNILTQKADEYFPPILEPATAHAKYIPLYKTRELPNINFSTPAKTLIELNRQLYNTEPSPSFPLAVARKIKKIKRFTLAKSSKRVSEFPQKQTKRLSLSKKTGIMQEQCKILKESNKHIRHCVRLLELTTREGLRHCKKHTELIEKSNAKAFTFRAKYEDPSNSVF